MEIRMICARFVLSVTLAIGMASAAEAQSYPEKPIKLVVPFPAGGATDTTARLVAQRLQASLGQSVIVENQGGAGGTIGSRQGARGARRLHLIDGVDRHLRQPAAALPARLRSAQSLRAGCDPRHRQDRAGR